MASKRKKKPKHASKKASIPIKKKDRSFLLGIVAAIISLVIFSPALSYDFVNWDDPANFLENPLVQEFSLKNITGIFSNHVIGNYNPLPIFMFAIERALFGFDPFWFHLINILFHAANVYLVFRFLQFFNLHKYACLFGALLFAIHPMRVESVVWVTERKDVLFGLFFLLSMIQYLHYRASGKRKHWMASFAFFIIGLFAKIQMVTLPLSLICLDYYFDKKLTLRSMLSKWPYFLGSLLFGLLGIYMLREMGSLMDETGYDGIQRLVIGGYSLVIYLVKFVYPYEMMPLYAYPNVLSTSVYIVSTLSILVLGGLFWLYTSKKYVLTFGLAFFLVNIFFLLQIVNAGQGFLADRFTYIAYLGLVFIAAFYFSFLLGSSKRWLLAFVLLGMTGMVFQTVQQSKIWRNSATLWTRVIETNDRIAMAYAQRANYYRDNNKPDLALPDYDRAISLDLNDGKTYNSRAKLLFDNGRLKEALSDYTNGLQLDPDNVEMLANRGAVYGALGQTNKAITDLSACLALDPNHANGYLNRSLMYLKLRQKRNALNDLNAYLGLKPNHADIWYERGKLHYELRDFPKAEQDILHAIRLNSGNAAYHYALAIVYLDSNRKDAARKAMDKAKALGIGPLNPSVQTRIYGTK